MFLGPPQWSESCVDRLYLDVYVPILQTGAGAAHFFRRVRGSRGGAAHRQGAGEGAGAAHGAAPASGVRPVSVAGVLDGDGQPLLRPRGGGPLRAVLPQVLLLLPVQREALRQRPRVPQAAVGEARRRVRGAEQRRPKLRRCGPYVAPCRRPDGVADRRPCATLLARPPQPFSRADRRASIRYDISILQAEFALTRMFDRPVQGSRAA